MIAAGCGALHLLFGLLLLTPAPYHGGDNGIYLALAKSLLEHGRYLELWEPIQRSATLYPPLFPVTLAAALAVGLTSWIQLKIVSLLISAIAVAVSVVWLERTSGRTTALVGGILLALGPGILQQAGYVLSEGLFWLFTMVALWAVAHIEAGESAHRRRWLIVTALAAAAAALTRSAGLPMIVAVSAAFMLQRRWRDSLLFAAVAIPPLLLWSLRTRLIGGPRYGSYLTMRDPYDPQLGSIGIPEFVQRIADNLIKYVTELAPSIMGGGGLMRVVLALLLVITLAWWLVRLVRRPDVVGIWLLLYSGLVLIWPETWAGERFVLAMVPAFIFMMADLLKTVRAHNATAGKAAAITAVVLAAAAIPPVLLTRIAEAGDCRRQGAAGDPFACMPAGYGDFMRVADAAGTALPTGSVVISRKPTLFFAQSGLRSMMYPFSADTSRFFAAADSVDADYVVIDQLSTLADRYLNPIVLNASEHFCVENSISNRQAVMLRIIRPPRTRIENPTADGFIAVPDCAGLP